MKHLLLFLAFSGASSACAQGEIREILSLDSLFWSAYNRCDVAGMGQFFSDDLEFYHDKGGPVYGKGSFENALSQNLCGRSDWRLRREAVSGTVQLFPLTQNGTPYGAILSGEHVFYILEKDRPAYLDGHARFTHLWLWRDGAWKMTRILSYDHGPAGGKR